MATVVDPRVSLKRENTPPRTIGVGGLAGGDEGDVFDYSQHRWFGPGLTNAHIIFIFQKIENSLPILVLVLGVLPSCRAKRG